MEEKYKDALETQKDFLSGYPNLKDFTSTAIKVLANATKSSNELPSGNKESWDFYSTFKDFRAVMETEREKIKTLIFSLLSFNDFKGRVPDKPLELLELLTEVNDEILERIHSHLDEFSGLKTDIDSVCNGSSGELLLSSYSSPSSSSSLMKTNISKIIPEVKLLTARNILRPQLQFKDSIDNSETPFIPKLKEKPNSLKPLSILIEYAEEDGREFYSHPYLFEINHFTPSKSMLSHSNNFENESKFISLERAEYEYVDTSESLISMMSHLKQESIIALDVEHHNYRSFLGLTCLIQISTNNKDFLIDPFPLWTQLTTLNDVLTDSKILKILHGSDSDILWLQRDFSLYIVNSFDTYRAAKLLNFPKGSLSLSSLLSHYHQITLNKAFQLADWRIRPLPPNMIVYAREDTRYLISLYSKMKKDLLDKGNETQNLLKSAYDRSNDVCRSRYEKPFSNLYELTRKSKISFNSRQLYALKNIYEWRQKICRIDDESEYYILPSHMMMALCSQLPRELQGIFALCNPIPPSVKQHINTLHRIILDAREIPLSLPLLETESHIESSSLLFDDFFLENPLNCPLELRSLGDKNVETLIDSKIPHSSSCISFFVTVKKTPSIVCFAQNEPSKTLGEGIKGFFLSPFERYSLLKPYLLSLKDPESEEIKTDTERINSIKEHFDALTSQTHKSHHESFLNEEKEEQEIEEEKEKIEEEDKIEEEEKVSDESEISKKIKIKTELEKFRRLSNKNKRKKTLGSKRGVKRKMENTVTGVIDYENCDLSQFSSGPKRNKNEFNPHQNFKNKYGGKNNRASRQKNKSKSSNKSHTYKA